MGTVYAALDPRNHPCAVKVLHSALASAPDFRERFERETELLARFRLPGVPAFRGAAPDTDRPWIATDYVPGPTLAEHLAAHGPLERGALFGLAAGTADVLRALHEDGVVHRDVKPGNVILGPDGPVVLDLGVARILDGDPLTRTGGLVGTPGWIAPELYEEADPGPAADVFAWGALVAFASTGTAPFGNPGEAESAILRVLDAAPDLSGVPSELHDLVGSALEADPGARPSAAAALGSVVTRWASRSPDRTDTSVGTLLAAEWPSRNAPDVDLGQWRRLAPRRGGRRRWWWTAAAAALALVTAGAALALTDRTEPPQQAGADGGAEEEALPDLPHGGAALQEDDERDLEDFTVLIPDLHEFSLMTQEAGEATDHADLTVRITEIAAAGDDTHAVSVEAVYNRDEGSYVLHSGDFSRQFRIPDHWEDDPPDDLPGLVDEPPGEILRRDALEPEVLAVLTPDEPEHAFTLTFPAFPDDPGIGALVYQVPPEGFWGYERGDSSQFADPAGEDFPAPVTADGSDSALHAVLCMRVVGGYPWDANTLRMCS